MSTNLPRAIMLLGTSSSVGKSLLTAAIGRCLTRRGLKVAPFKAQNMSLNSHITAAGAEIGVAQAIQARACDLEPDAAMNPILLKPMGRQGSQILALGRPYATLPYSEYIQHKRKLWAIVTEAYKSLATGRDLMLLEGAGSPAEINLRAHDIVNMAMCHFAQAKAILIADIDRGGAFAALAGTLALLHQHDRKRISAFLLNKFRGDPELLSPALETITARYRRPFVGIMPMLANLRLPEEDSASMAERPDRYAPAPAGKLDIVIPELPFLSNMADLDPLAQEPGVHLRMAANPGQLGNPHILIIPGSRHVPKSLEFLRQSGLAQAIIQLAQKMQAQGCGQIVGICAGLEILGTSLADPSALEGGGNHRGLALLPLATILKPQKSLLRHNALALPPLVPQVLPCSGQEIHHGQCHTELSCVIKSREGKPLGWGDVNCQIWGSWLHSLWDCDQFRHIWLNAIASQFGLGIVAGEKYDPDAELNRLADAAEENLDIERILSLF